MPSPGSDSDRAVLWRPPDQTSAQVPRVPDQVVAEGSDVGADELQDCLAVREGVPATASATGAGTTGSLRHHDRARLRNEAIPYRRPAQLQAKHGIATGQRAGQAAPY
jgi:hypothetical protein